MIERSTITKYQPHRVSKDVENCGSLILTSTGGSDWWRSSVFYIYTAVGLLGLLRSVLYGVPKVGD